MSELETVVAQAFKVRGKTRLTQPEFIFALSLDLNWFSQEESRDVLLAAIGEGLLKQEGDRIVPSFNLKNVFVPPGYRPGPGVLKPKSIMDRITTRMSDAGIPPAETEVLIKSKQEALDYLVTPEVAGLIILKERGLAISDLIDEAYEKIIAAR